MTYPLSQRVLTFLVMVTIASLGWLYVTALENRVGAFPGKIPLVFKNVASSLVALPEETSVSVRLRADEKAWASLSVESFSAVLDLDGLGVGVHEVAVQVAVSVPNVQIVEKLPGTITIRLEESITKEVPVRVVVQGEVASGLAPGEASATPDRVLVIGAKSLVAAITDAEALITLDGESSEVKRTVELKAFGQEGGPLRGVRFDPATVGVSVPVVQASDTRTVGVRAVTIAAPKEGYYVQKIAISPATVVIKGSIAVFTLDTAPIDLTNLSQTTTVSAAIVFPSGVSLIEGPRTVTVTLTIAALPASKRVPLTFSFVDLNPSLKVATVDPAAGSVIASGPTENLASLNSLTAKISLAGLLVGSHTLDVKLSDIETASGVTVSGSPLPSAVTVVLEPK